MKKLAKLVTGMLKGALLLIIGTVLMIILVAVRIVSLFLERVLYYPHWIVKHLADGSASLLKAFATGYESAVAKKRREKEGVVLGGVSSVNRRPS